MNQEIKKRIEDINNGIVPEGYKQTPFGIFPCDWETDKLGNLGHFKNGINKDKDKFGYGVPIIGLMDVFGVNYIDSTSKSDFVDATIEEQEDYSVKKGDVLFVRSSVKPSGVGLTAVATTDFEGVVFSGFLLRYRTNSFTTDFKRYVFNSSYFRNNVIAASTVSANTNVNQENLNRLSIVYPVYDKEQSKIAEILMKWDEMVELQEQYIQKLELRKKSYIDKFFTEKSYNCVFKDLYIQAGEGGTPDTKKVEYYENGNIPFVKIEHLYKKCIEEIDSFITEEGLKKSGAWLVPENSLIFSNGATIGECSINRIPVTTKQGILGIVPSGIIELEYFYYLLKSEYFLKKAKKITTKGTMCTAYLKDIDKLKLYTHSKVEQSAISKLLGKVDEEISLQKEKLEKIKIQRKAMQQYLLTGIVRVG